MPDIDSILTAITVDTGRTLDAYRHDLRVLFQWANDNNLEVLAATRAHIEIFRGWLEQTGLAPSTVDRRLSTVCGYYRFAHIDGHIASNPAQYVRRPKVPPPRAAEPTAAIAPCASSAKATNRPSSRSCPVPPAPLTSSKANEPTAPSYAAKTTPAWTGAPPTDGSNQPANGLGSDTFTLTCRAPRSSWPISGGSTFRSSRTFPCGAIGRALCAAGAEADDQLRPARPAVVLGE
ncbi:MAG: site-specific integrase [Planctomycetaceae bacterium]|nr:site-specific integrase [Planctomycetaceae bacterium]